MQLAPGWRTGANCDRYPRGIGDSGKRVPTLDQHTIEAPGCLLAWRLMSGCLLSRAGQSRIGLANTFVILSRCAAAITVGGVKKLSKNEMTGFCGTLHPILALCRCAVSGPPLLGGPDHRRKCNG
jgi:hypothetical protein